MLRKYRSTIARGLLAPVVLLIASCGESAPVSAPVESVAYDTSLNLQDFMNLVLDPVADTLWDSAGWEDSVDGGYQEFYPVSDEEWENVRRAAAQIIEIGNALAIPGRAVDNEAWLTYANGLSQAGSLAMQAATARNNEDFFLAGAQLYNVCTACHQAYITEPAPQTAGL